MPHEPLLSVSNEYQRNRIDWQWRDDNAPAIDALRLRLHGTRRAGPDDVVPGATLYERAVDVYRVEKLTHNGKRARAVSLTSGARVTFRVGCRILYPIGPDECAALLALSESRRAALAAHGFDSNGL